MSLDYLGLDFETYYCSKSGYSLKSKEMDNPSYILDPRFEATLCAVKINGNPAGYVDGPQLPAFFKSLDPSRYIMYGHNLMFDACIAAWHFGFVPAMYICTLALGRQLWAKDCKHLSLDALCKYHNLPVDKSFLQHVNGMRRAEIIARGLWPQYTQYAITDIERAWDLLNIGAPQVSPEELRIADMVLRMATQPRFKLNADLLARFYNEEAERKAELLREAMAVSNLQDASELQSNDKFAEVLMALGVDPPVKTSLKTGKQTWAFAKNDHEMKELLDHEDPAVVTVVEARFGHKSTMGITRARRYYRLSQLTIPAYEDGTGKGKGWFPVPLKVSGAHTHRLSGDWQLNAQNPERNKPELPPCDFFPTGRPARLSTLRQAWEAPDDDHVVIAVDASQIEARLNAAWCGQDDLIQQFIDKLDPYGIMATDIFGYPVTKAQVPERFCGKQVVLGGQYGSGPPKFRLNTISVAREQAGIDLRPILTPEMSERIINTYRAKTPQITLRRRMLDNVIARMARPDCNFWIGPVHFTHEEVTLPGGLKLYYRNLRFDPQSGYNGQGGWIYQYKGMWRDLYGGKLMENIIQALARCVVMQAALRVTPILYNLGGAKIDLQVHDEIVSVVHKSYAQRAFDAMMEEMSRPIEWMPNCPVACEGGMGPNYAEAK